MRAFVLFPHPQNYQVVGVAWTLDYEIFFYLLFGLLILNKRLGAVVLLGWAGCVLANGWFETYPWNFLFSYLHVRFLAGIAVALVLQRWKIPAPRFVACLGMALFLGAGLLHVYHAPLSNLNATLGYALGSALMLGGLVQAERSGLIRPPNWLVYLGDASYAIYLVHFFALSVLAKIAKTLQLDAYLPGSVLFGLLALGSVGVGCLFHHLVEHRLHNLTKRFFRRERDSVVAQEAASEQVRKAA